MTRRYSNGNGEFRWQAVSGVLNVAMIVLLTIFGYLGANVNTMLLRLNDTVIRLEEARNSDMRDIEKNQVMIEKLQQEIITLKMRPK